MTRPKHDQLPEDVERELAALADGSLAAGRRARAHERAQASPALSAALAEQRRAVELLRTADDLAPPSLHASITALAVAAGEETPSRRGPQLAGSRRRRLRSLRRYPSRVGMAFAAATAIAGFVGIMLALGSPGGGGGTGNPPGSAAPQLNASTAAALALGPATAAAPSESASDRGNLAVAVDGVPFPYWKERFGWHGSGSRTDTLGGHAVTTVFYSDARGQRIGYAIAAGPAPATPGGTVVERWGVPYRLSSQEGANVIVWRRHGHMCVMAGRGVSPSTLLRLASSDGERQRAA